MTKPDQVNAETSNQPPEGLRTFITFLIFVHLFALGVAVVSRTGTRSGFERNLFERTGASFYLHTLGMDLGYDFALTRRMGDDSDHVCDIVLEAPRGFRGTDEEITDLGLESIPLMPEGIWSNARRRRYLMLALRVFMNAADDDISSRIPQELVDGMLAQANVEGGKHQFRCRTLRPRHWEGEINLAPRDPRMYADDYRADVVASGPGEWSLVKVASRGETTQLQSGDSNQGNQSGQSKQPGQ